MHLFVGTYSFSFAGVEGNGEGIYSVLFDPETGAFGEVRLVAKCRNPSSLALSGDKSFLFAGREVFKGDEPAISSYAVVSGAKLKAISTLLLAGELPCHLAIGAGHNRLASAQYWTGDVVVSTIDEGMFKPPTYLTREGRGPNIKRQDGPHAHFIAFTNQDTVLHIVDLGTDSIVSHKLSTGSVVLDTSTLRVSAGSGPRHMVINQAETRAWVVCELDESLIMLRRAGLGWVIDSVQPAFPTPLEEDGSASAIRLSPDERNIYISGRRQSQIAAFTNEGGSLGSYDCGGICPRDFIITPDGNWIISANQNSNTLTSLRRDPETGSLIQSGYSCKVGSPVALIGN